MRTFIFVKTERDIYNRPHRIIKGMTTGNYYPSAALIPGADFYNCDCIEVSEKCSIDLGIFKD